MAKKNIVSKNLYGIVRAGQIMAGMVSWVATTYGILAWDNDKSIALDTIINPSSLGVIVSVLAITIFTILLLDFSLKQKKIFNKLLLGVFYLMFAFISIGFGYGFWWNKLESTNKITNSLEQDIDRATNNMADVKSHLDGVYFELNKLQEIANKKEKQEDARGGSCENQIENIDDGRGPFYHARKGISESINKLSNDVTEMSGSISSLHNELMELITKNKNDMQNNLAKNIDISISVKKFRQVYNRKIRDTRNEKINSILTEIKDKITILKNALKKGGNYIRPEIIETRNIQMRHCQDLSMNTQVKNLSSKIDKVIKSINEATIKFESEDKSGRIKMALLGVWNKVMPTSLATKDNTFPLSLFSLALAILFDFLLLFFTVALNIWGLQRTYYPNLKNKIKEEFGGKNQGLGIEYIDLFNKYIFKFEDKSYLVYPTMKYVNESLSYVPINHYNMIIAKLKKIEEEAFVLINQKNNKNIQILHYAKSKLEENDWVEEDNFSQIEIYFIKYSFLLDVVEILEEDYNINEPNKGKTNEQFNSKINKDNYEEIDKRIF